MSTSPTPRPTRPTSPPTPSRSPNTAGASWCGPGRNTLKEGALRSRHVVIEFKDYATALACYESPEYQSALALRKPPVAQGDLVIIEGYEGPQPA